MTVRNDNLESLKTSLQNERKWRNVQLVLPESFALVVHVLTEQTFLIEKLQQRVNWLERKQTAALKPESVTVLEETIRTDFKRWIARARKEFSAALAHQQTILKQVKEESEINNVYINKVEQSVKQQCSEIKEQLNLLKRETDEHFNSQEVCFKSAKILDEEKLTQLRQLMVHKFECLECKLVENEAKNGPYAEQTAALEIKATEIDALQDELARMSRDINEAEARIGKQVALQMQELTIAIGKKLCKSELAKLLSRKMDAIDAWKQLAEKVDNCKLEEVACTLMDSIQRSEESMMVHFNRLKQLNESKADTLELIQVKHNMHNLVSIAESMQHELSTLQSVVSEKMNGADVKALLNSQTSLNETTNQVESAATAEYATKSEISDLNTQVQTITRQLRSEMYQARYIWKDGRLSTTQTIQWSSQVVNTNADIFLWQVGSDAVKLKLPGLYHLQAAFFTTSFPTIQVLVNNEPAILQYSPTDQTSVVDRPLLQRLHHSAGSVAGLAIDVFLALPARAVISISYDIEEKAQGFLNLRKL